MLFRSGVAVGASDGAALGEALGAALGIGVSPGCVGAALRSEERRVGKECKSRGSPAE